MKKFLPFILLSCLPFLLFSQWNNAISGQFFYDNNYNGIQDAGDTGAADWVYLYDCGEDKISHSVDDMLIDSINVLTNPSSCPSCYTFSNLPPSVYFLGFSYKLQTGFMANIIFTYPYIGSSAKDSDVLPATHETTEILVDSNSIISHIDAGYVLDSIYCPNTPKAETVFNLISPTKNISVINNLYLPTLPGNLFPLSKVEIYIKPVISVRRWVENDDTSNNTVLFASLDTVKISGLGLNGTLELAIDTLYSPLLNLAPSDNIYMSGPDFASDTTYWAGKDTVISITAPDTLALFAGNGNLTYHHLASGAAIVTSSSNEMSFHIRTSESLIMTVTYKYCETFISTSNQTLNDLSYSIHPQYIEDELILKFTHILPSHPLDIRIYNAMGQLLSTTQYATSTPDLSIPFEGKSSGIYYIDIAGKLEKFIWN